MNTTLPRHTPTLLLQATRALQREADYFIASLRNPRTRRLIVLCSIVLLVCFTATYGTHAQILGGGGTDGGKVTTTLKNLIETIYFQWRIPICILGLTLAAVAFFSTSPHGKAWALRIFAGVIIWALIPTFIDLISSWTGTTGSNNIGSGSGI